MAPIVFLLSIIFTLFATAILAYVSMTSMIGPWLAPSIALLGSFLIRRLYPKSSNHANQYHVASLQAISAGGGTIAVGVGFALPMLYFLDPVFFANLLDRPGLFVLYVGITILCAGSLGIVLANRYVGNLIVKQKLPFPSSKLTFNVIQAQAEEYQTNLLGVGFFCSALFCFLRDGMRSFAGLFPKTLCFFNFSGSDISISLSPMLLAIGFSAGSTIMFPLAVGFGSKILVYPFVRDLSAHISCVNPASLSIGMGFCSGIILAGVLWGACMHITTKRQYFSMILSFLSADGISSWLKSSAWYYSSPTNQLLFFEIGVVALAGVFLLFAGFNFFATTLFLGMTSIATYQICLISGHIGMVQFGRFSTFIMIPMILMFSLSPVHLTLICLFFHICAASASDHLFDFNIFRLGNFSTKNLLVYQFIGLVITALSLGFVLWLLFSAFEPGSPDLFAQRAQAKALLVQSLSFDEWALLFGLIFGLILKLCRVNPTMALGGLLMPSGLVMSLLLGAIIAAYFKEKHRYAPLCAGILAGESVWVILSVILRAFL